MPTLKRVLSYEHPVLVSYFAAKHNISIDDSKELFDDLKKWLWVCANRSEDAFPVRIFQEFSIVDDYWHTFLAFTKDYQKFCDEYFGFFVHHNPQGNIDGVSQKKLADSKDVVEINLAYLKQSMREVARILGPEILDRWYREIPGKYASTIRSS